jgi:hypothetical protein
MLIDDGVIVTASEPWRVSADKLLDVPRAVDARRRPSRRASTACRRPRRPRCSRRA